MTERELRIAVLVEDMYDELYYVNVKTISPGNIRITLTFNSDVEQRDLFICRLYETLHPIMPIGLNISIYGQ